MFIHDKGGAVDDVYGFHAFLSKFLGWSITYDPNGSSSVVQYNPGDPYTTDANLYLYAVWAKDDGVCYICVDGVMKRYQPYVYKDGAWKRCVPYIYTNGEFKLFS